MRTTFLGPFLAALLGFGATGSAIFAASHGVGPFKAEPVISGEASVGNGAAVGQGESRGEVAESTPSEEPAPLEGTAETGESPEVRPTNHGFYVSQAAKCGEASDGSVAFTPPSPCEGREKGEYVSGVARSDLGKPTPAPEVTPGSRDHEEAGEEHGSSSSQQGKGKGKQKGE